MCSSFLRFILLRHALIFLAAQALPPDARRKCIAEFAAVRHSQFDDVMIPPPREPMTIAELKRHMDRRFDRLERTKADKRDLAWFATKKDLRRFATKKDLGQFPTKSELQRSNADIKRYFKIVAEGLEEKIQKVADGMSQIAALQLHMSHHAKILDEHETRITVLERNR